MIGDAVDTLITLVAYMALVMVIPALLLGHQGQDWPLRPRRGAWRGRGATETPPGHSGCSEVLPESPRPRTAIPAPATRPAPRWAHTDTKEAA